MANSIIINAALTGMVPRKADVPHLPETPDEIAADAARVAAAGASIVHLHARVHGEPTHEKEVYGDIVEAVRARCPELVICVSCSGRHVRELAQRSEVLELDGDRKPDMASLTLGSLNFPGQASVNDPTTIAGLATRMREHGIRPELEAFEPGMVEVAHYLLRKDVIDAPLYFNLLLGSRGTAACTPMNVAAMTAALPAGSTWALAGIGRFQFGANLMAIAAGGHVRVGLEDNVWMDD
ncbi:MAG: 3-keto-5-aminohexanoate cleavage protein, partial [Planctomycetota bacterium]